jgi:hypothetical protein
MNSNTHSAGSPDGLTALAAVADQLAAEHRAGLPAPVRVDRVLALRQVMDRLEGQWLAELAAVDAAGRPAPKTACRSARPPAGCVSGCA